MADMYDFLANSSNENLDDNDDLTLNGQEDEAESRFTRHRYQKRRGHSSQKSVFVPVAAYSVTHSRVPGRPDPHHRMRCECNILRDGIKY